jgi:phospholipid transport system substrate-binding protein
MPLGWGRCALRRLASFLLFACLAAGGRAGGPPAPAATAQGLCDALIAVMKQGRATTFEERKAALSPEVRQDFDLAAMTRIIVGPPWKGLSAADRQDVTDAFSDYSVANYAQRFKSYSGERFEVDPAPSALPSGDCIVHTKLHTGDPEPVQLDYMMRLRDGRWRIIDVFLSGTISELAARRSEYSLVLRTGGAPALVDLLKRKTAELSR